MKLQERTYEHSGTSIEGNKPITVGQGYSTIAWIPESEGSWALPLRHERITSAESPIGKAIWQLKQVCKHLPVTQMSFWDSEYGCAPFVLKTANIQADILVRLRSNLCLWGQPGAYSGKGQPKTHGDKFKLNERTTWSEATSVLEVNDLKLERVSVSLWKDLYFCQAATRPMLLIRVEGLDTQGNMRVSKPL
ncbi:transposase [Trichormus azollae]|uniref:transposase n=1 Tax=Trichormus azollae TaxID=1164 RepID=UPI00325CD03D